MARFTMQQLEQLTVGQGDGFSTSQNHEGADTSQNLVWYQPTIHARIFDALSRGGQMTRLEIARALGLKKTPWLVSCIDRLAAEGYVTRIEARTPQGVIMYVYEVRK